MRGDGRRVPAGRHRIYGRANSSVAAGGPSGATTVVGAHSRCVRWRLALQATVDLHNPSGAGDGTCSGTGVAAGGTRGDRHSSVGATLDGTTTSATGDGFLNRKFRY